MARPRSCRNAYGTDAVHSATASIQRKSSAQPRPVSLPRNRAGHARTQRRCKAEAHDSRHNRHCKQIAYNGKQRNPSADGNEHGKRGQRRRGRHRGSPQQLPAQPCCVFSLRRAAGALSVLCAAITQSTPNVAENERSRLASTAAYGFCRHKSSAARLQ